MKKITTIACAAAISLGLSACGGGSAPEDTVKEFTQAIADKDFEKACELLDPEFVKTAEEAGGEDCATSMEQGSMAGGDDSDVDPDKIEFGEAKISEDGNSATVPTTYEGETSEVKLIKVDDEWKVTLGL